MKLNAYFESQMAVPFEWRARNCCHFAAGWVAAAEGSCDLSEFVMPEDFDGVRAALGAHESIKAAISSVLARPARPGALAQIGDVVLIPLRGGRFTVGINNGRLTAVAGVQGLDFLNSKLATASWRIEWQS